MKRCDMSTSKVHDNRCLFVNVNKISVAAIVPEQSESASFVTLVEIHNVDVPAASNRDATVLSPTAGTLCSGHAQSQSILKLSLIRTPIHMNNRSVSPTIGSSFPVAKRKLRWQANHEQLGCAKSSKFILFFVQ